MINKYLKMISRATIKLTLFYTAIIFVISLCFSVAIGLAAITGVRQPFDHEPDQIVLNDGTQMSFQPIVQHHDREVTDGIVAGLIIVNLIVLFFGAGLSFVLARWTLQPIEKAMRDQTDFIANASHELRTPLAVIQTENEVLLREPKPSKSELREKVTSNLAEVQKLRRLADYLLAMNSEENSQPDWREVDLLELLREPLTRITGPAEQKHIAIKRAIQPVKITTDPERLAEIVYVLLDNAVKYSPKNATITVTGRTHEISVADQGSGVAETDRVRIFERFYRAEKSHTGDGFGLGLSLAQTLANKIHAKINVKNIHNHDKIVGAKFIVRL